MKITRQQEQQQMTPMGDRLILDPLGFLYAHCPGAAIRDWTSPAAYTAENTNRWGRVESKYEKTWYENYKKNKPNIKESIPEGEPVTQGMHHGQTCYLTADGPSMSMNGSLLAGLDHVIETNRIYPGIQPKYYVSLDCGYPHGGANPKWVDGINTDKTIGVCSVFNRPSMAKKFRRVWFYDAWGNNNKVSNKSRLRFPFMKPLDTAINVSYTALNFAYQMGYKKIVLVGFDYAYTGGKVYFSDTEPSFKIVDVDGKKQLEVSSDVAQRLREKQEEIMVDTNPNKAIDGGVSYTTKEFLTALHYFATACWFLSLGGIEIVNCSAGGILTPPWIKVDKLENHV